MLANTKRLKNKINELRLPWWFNLVKLGIPYTLATATSITIMLVLGGWIPMPEAVPLLKWVEALFMAMQPAIKFLAVNLVGLGSFLSTLAITSLFVRGCLFNVTEKAALEGLEASEQLLAQTKELQDNILTQSGLNEQFKNQSEFLKGYATALKGGTQLPHQQEPMSQPPSQLGVHEAEQNQNQDQELQTAQHELDEAIDLSSNQQSESYFQEPENAQEPRTEKTPAARTLVFERFRANHKKKFSHKPGRYVLSNSKGKTGIKGAKN